jgi:phosphohistidine swiveling domain-containing protein
MPQSKKKIFIADKLSGFEGSIFGVSPIINVIANSNRLNKFKYPFYATTVSSDLQKGGEWVDQSAYEVETARLLKYVNKNGLAYFDRLRRKTQTRADLLMKKSVRLQSELEGLSDKELVKKFADFMEEYLRYYGEPAVTFLYEAILSDRLSESISARSQKSVSIIGGLLKTHYKSFMLASEIELYKIKKAKSAAKQVALVNLYLKNFFFIKVNYNYTPALTSRDVFNLARSSHPVSNKATSKKRVIKLSADEKIIIGLLKENEAIRDQRKKINLIGNYTMYRFLEIICRRRGVAIPAAKKIIWQEFPELVLKTKSLLAQLKKRNEFSFVLSGQKIYRLEYNALRPRTSVNGSVREFKGTPASAGKIRGRVRIVFGSREFSKFKAGEILVAEMTRPDFLPIMRKAGAFITDEGGLTCHAAIVARELHKPCIIGTKIATQVLRDGDIIEVDANEGSIRRL